MRWRVAIAAGLLLVGLGAAPGWAQDALTGALLTPADLPAGWQMAGPLSADAGVSFGCPALGPPPPPLEYAGELLVAASGAQMVYQQVRAYPPGEAAQLLAAAMSETGPCQWAQSMDDGATATLRMSMPTPLPLAAAAATRTLVLASPDLALTAALVLLACGDRLTQLTLLPSELASGAGATDVLALLVPVAAQRLCGASP